MLWCVGVFCLEQGYVTKIKRGAMNAEKRVRHYEDNVKGFKGEEIEF